MAPLKWGFCTAGKISFDFANALQSLSREKHQLEAVAARHLDRAEDFKKKFGFTKAYGSYEELANDNEVNVVYVAAKMNAHFDLCKLFLHAGKHVLCEKALTCAAWQAKELVALAESKGLFLMEGIWSRCFPLYAALRELINSGELGEVYGVESHLHVQNYAWLEQEPGLGGCMWDLGIYPLQFAHFVFGGETQTRTQASGRVLQSGADLIAFGTLQYSKGRFASFTASFADFYDKPSVIYAEKALVTIEGVWAPTSMTIAPKDGQPRTVQFEALPKLAYDCNYKSSGGFVYEAEHVFQCISAHLTESPLVPHSLSIWLQQTMDEILQQVGRTNLPEKQNS